MGYEAYHMSTLDLAFRNKLGVLLCGFMLAEGCHRPAEQRWQEAYLASATSYACCCCPLHRSVREFVRLVRQKV